MSSKPVHGEMYSIQHYKVCQWFSPGTPASSTTKTGHHDIAESGIKHNKSINHKPIMDTDFCVEI